MNCERGTFRIESGVPPEQFEHDLRLGTDCDPD